MSTTDLGREAATTDTDAEDGIFIPLPAMHGSAEAEPQEKVEPDMTMPVTTVGYTLWGAIEAGVAIKIVEKMILEGRLVGDADDMEEAHTALLFALTACREADTRIGVIEAARALGILDREEEREATKEAGRLVKKATENEDAFYGDEPQDRDYFIPGDAFGTEFNAQEG